MSTVPHHTNPEHAQAIIKAMFDPAQQDNAQSIIQAIQAIGQLAALGFEIAPMIVALIEQMNQDKQVPEPAQKIKK